MKQNKPTSTNDFINAFKKQASIKPTNTTVKKLNIKDIKSEGVKAVDTSKQNISPSTSSKECGSEKKRTIEIPDAFNTKSEVKINPSTISIDKQSKITISPGVKTSGGTAIQDSNMSEFRLDSLKRGKAAGIENNMPSSLNNTKIDLQATVNSSRQNKSGSKSTNQLAKILVKKNTIASPMKSPRVNATNILKPQTTSKKLNVTKAMGITNKPITVKEKSPIHNDSASIKSDNIVKQVIIANPNTNTLDVDMVKTLDLQTLDDPPIKQCIYMINIRLR
jgi:hypothetical protein